MEGTSGANGERKENPEKDEEGIFECRPVTAEEGDRWYDEDGKVWEMGMGGPMRVPKFQSFRMPMFCPECKKIMNGKFDGKFWRLEEHCFECHQREEQTMRINGTFEIYEKRKILENKKSWLRDARQRFEEFKKTIGTDTQHVINSQGQISQWYSSLSDEKQDEIIERSESFLEEFEQEIQEGWKELEAMKAELSET